MKKAFWLKNNTANDVGLGDLGIKIPAGQTINLFKYSPYLTVQQIEQSKTSGSLLKRLEANTLSIVRKHVAKKPHDLEHIKATTVPTKVVRTKSSIVIDTEQEEVLSGEDFGEFADYGLGELGHSNTKHVALDNGSVVVEQKTDVEKTPDQELLEQASYVKTKTTLEKQKKLATDVTKQLSQTVQVPGKSATVVTETESETEFDARVATTGENGAVMMELKETETPEVKKTKKRKPRKTSKKTK